MILGTVAVIGRPNVGKSTLFNRLTRSKKAIVDDRPGVTRDRIYGQVFYNDDKDSGFTVIDTGGFETDDFKFQPFADNLVWQQTEEAIREADLVILLFDGLDGLQQHDRELTHYLNKLNKKVIYVVNKVDGQEHKAILWDFLSLGIPEPLVMSAQYSRGIGQLKSEIMSRLSELGLYRQQALESSDEINLAIIGRPNVGKSSLLNRLCGRNRSLVSDIAGTTRDAIDVELKYNGRRYKVIDTAGMRRKSKVEDRVEGFSIIRSLNTIDQADIIIVVIDAIEGLTDQDTRIINLATDRFKPVLLVINKWDLVENKETMTAKHYEDELKYRLGDLAYLKILFVSCKENLRVFKIMDWVETLYQQYEKRVPTQQMNEVIQQIVHEHTPQLIRKMNKRVKFYFATQVEVKPPTIVIKCNVAGEIQDSYERYLLKRLSQMLGFELIPLRILFRDKINTRKEKNLSTIPTEADGVNDEDQSLGV